MDYKKAIEVLANEIGCVDLDTNNRGYIDESEQKFMDACNTAISAMEELQEYHKTGLSFKQVADTIFELGATKRVLGHYQQLGTLEEVREALEKAEKYHWHNLRENPDDLPKNLSGIYLFENKWGQVFKGTFRAVGDIKLFEAHIYSKEHGGDIWLQYKTCNVVWWKEIDPFEEG